MLVLTLTVLALQPPELQTAAPQALPAQICLSNACVNTARVAVPAAAVPDPAALNAAIAANDHLGVIRAGGTAKQALQAALNNGSFYPPNAVGVDMASVRYTLRNDGRPAISWYSNNGLFQSWVAPDLRAAIEAGQNVSSLPRSDAFPIVPRGTYQPVEPVQKVRPTPPPPAP